MTSIELTKKQQKKLLEMLKEIFPEYDFEFKLRDNLLSYGLKTISTYTNVIHWFEFCFRYLAPKILKDYQEYMDFCHRCLFCSEKPHIVDYIYKHFKNTK